MPEQLCWRQYPHLFRGAAGWIRRAGWCGTAELDETHRLILRAAGVESPLPPGVKPMLPLGPFDDREEPPPATVALWLARYRG